MVLWRPDLRLDAPSVEFPLQHKDLDRYATDELEHFTREAAKVYTNCKKLRRYTRASLKQLLSSINIAWDVIDERRAARRMTVLDPGFATTSTVHVRATSREEHIYLSPWIYADPGRSADPDSEWSSTEQSNGCALSTEDGSAAERGGQKTRLYNKSQKPKKVKAQYRHQRKNFVSKAKNHFHSLGRDDSEDGFERPRRQTRTNSFFERNSSIDSASA